MRSKHIFLCQLIVLMHLTRTKAVSQNVANLRSLGYMPDQVALEIRQMQNGYSAPRYQQAYYGAYANSFTQPETDEEPIKEIKPRSGQKKKTRHTQEREEEDSEVKTDEDAKERYVIKDVVIEFDELVNKVKDRLKDEFNEKKKYSDQQNTRHGRKKELRNNPDMNNREKDINQSLKNIYKFNNNQEKANEPREDWKHFMTTKSPKTVVLTSDAHPSHVRVPMKKSKKHVHANDKIFEVADLTKVKDSYEDYVTPKRGKMYASDTETDVMNPLPKNEREPNESYKEKEEPHEPKKNYKENERPHKPKENYKENEEPNEPQETYKENKELQEEFQYKKIPKAVDILKAGRSSDKLRNIKKLDDPISFVQEDYDPNETEKPVEHAEKAMFVKLGGDSDDEPAKLKGTMIPTRQFFKMSSPNYFGKLPAVAEKYDFNEPLPEKDREPEKIKYFINPPARINKKVRLQPNTEAVQENE